MRRLLTVALFLAPMVAVLAQDYGPPQQVKDLGWTLGTWTGSGKIAFGGHEVEITSTMTVSFDGQFLKAVSADKSAGSTLTKTTMTGWEPKKGEYISYTFTNAAPTARIAHGKLAGSTLQMISDPWEAEGFTMVARESMSKISDTKCGLVMEYQQGDKWVKGMDIVLTKQ
jgi:hypothetical protein